MNPPTFNSVVEALLPHDAACRCIDCAHAAWAELEAHWAYIDGIEGGAQ